MVYKRLAFLRATRSVLRLCTPRVFLLFQSSVAWSLAMSFSVFHSQCYNSQVYNITSPLGWVFHNPLAGSSRGMAVVFPGLLVL